MWIYAVFTPWLILHHGMSFMKVQKTHLETLNMGLGVHGRAPYGITWSTSRRSRTGLWFLIYNKEQTNIWIVFMSNKFKVVFSTFIVISKQSFDMHLTFAAAYQRNKIMFNNQTLQNIKIVVLRSMFSIRTRTKSGKFETSTRYNRTRTNKKLKILDHILVHFGIFCRGLCEPYYSL